MSGKYFPNKWRKLKDIPAENFDPIYFDDLMEWKVSGWELPDDVACIIRACALSDHKVTEHVYKRMSAAENKIRQYMMQRMHELFVCADEALYYVHPELIEDRNNDDD